MSKESRCPNWDCGYCVGHMNREDANVSDHGGCLGYNGCEWYKEWKGGVEKRQTLEVDYEVNATPGCAIFYNGEYKEDANDSVLMEAYNLTRGDRGSDYGHPLDDFAKTAMMWSAITGATVTEEMVAMMMTCLKISRELNRHKRDNLVDACGYMSTIEMINEERKRRAK